MKHDKLHRNYARCIDRSTDRDRAPIMSHTQCEDNCPIPFQSSLHPFSICPFQSCFPSMISGEGVGGGDEKDLLKDNLMRDIQDGFRQRRLPDGGFKVSGE